MTKVGDIIIDLGNLDFLLPYILRQLNADEADADIEPRAMVRISDGIGPEPDKAHECMPTATLVCPNVVGTGMTGLMRRIAGGIYRGSFVHIADNEARISVIHAVDVARAVATVAGHRGSYVLTDGSDPTIHDLAEAFAYRLDNKRIITIKPRWARFWYGKTYFQTLTTDHVHRSTFLDAFPDFNPVEVTNYLKTHVYDEKSL